MIMYGTCGSLCGAHTVVLIAFSTVGSRLPAKGDAVWVKYRSQNFWPTLVSVRQLDSAGCVM